MNNLNNEVKIVPSTSNALPRLAKDDNGNACYDVFATSMRITDKFVEYGLGFKTEFSEDWMFSIRPRSSNSKKDLLMCNAPGTIDSNYRGEWLVRFKVVDNHSNPDIYQIGDAVAQISFERVIRPNWIIVKESSLSESSRGEGGFGSTDANVK